MLRLTFFKTAAVALLLSSCIPAQSTEPAAQPGITTPAGQPGTPPSRPASATPDLRAAVMTASPPEVYAAYPSPDDRWRIEILIHDCVQIENPDPDISAVAHALEQLQLVDVHTGSVEIVDSQLLNCGGLGAFGFDGRQWSSNSRYFYYTDAREGQPDGLCSYWVPPLVRLDVTDRRVEHLGMGPFSPDGTRLATWQNQDLVVWDLEEGELERSPALLPDAGRGEIAWSPDGESLVYIQTDEFCPGQGTSHIIRLDLPELEPEQLIESEDPFFVHVIWDAAGSLIVSNMEGKAWRYDLDAEQLIEAATSR